MANIQKKIEEMGLVSGSEFIYRNENDDVVMKWFESGGCNLTRTASGPTAYFEDGKQYTIADVSVCKATYTENQDVVYCTVKWEEDSLFVDAFVYLIVDGEIGQAHLSSWATPQIREPICIEILDDLTKPAR